jgi:branched-chain amino acid transport system ATP-binding protein
MSDVLTVENVSAFYGRSQALRDVSFSLGAGENAAVVGPNGAGKSTLLKLISGLVPARPGRVCYGTLQLHRMVPEEIVKAGIVHVPEGRQVFPGLSVSENLWLGGYAAPAQRERRLAEVTELFPRLRERMNQAADSLSGGEQQMLAIARGLMAAPRLLMLDEPGLGLAPVIIDQLIVALRRMAKELGVGLLIAEQSLNLTHELCSIAHVLVDGRIISSVRPGETSANALMTAYLGQVSNSSPALPGTG